MNNSVKNIEMKNRAFLNKIRKSKYIRGFMAFLGLNMISQIVFPTAAMALTSGASSPEFSSFEPVATTNMVNDFSGSFTYNLPVISIPGPDGAGYSMSLSYHSGVSAEEEASWVGFGWTLNPGAINRNKRGYADDFNGATVTKYNKVKPNWTSGSAFDFNVEFNSNDKGKKGDRKKRKENGAKGRKEGVKSAKIFKFKNLDLFKALTNKTDEEKGGIQFGISLSNSIRFNNYSGFSNQKGFGANVMGIASLNMNRSGGENTYGVHVNPLFILKQATRIKIVNNLMKTLKSWSKKKPKLDKLLSSKITKKASNILISNIYSSWSFNAPAVPYSVAKNAGIAYNVSFSLEINPYGPLGFQAGLKGSLNAQANYPKQDKTVYGYMHNPTIETYENRYDDNNQKNFNDPAYKNDIEADFQIEKASTFNKHDRNLGIPFNSADIFSTTGNGVMGGFQIHHKKIGHFYPSFLENRQRIIQLGVEAGVGGTLQFGFDVGAGFQKTRVMDWRKIEKVEDDSESTVKSSLEFSNSDIFMRFNGDMGGLVSYSNSSLLHAKIGGKKVNRKLDLKDLYQKNYINSNESRTSYIEYAEYNNSGNLDSIKVLDESVSNINKGNSIYKDLLAQIAVTDKSGNKSNYGLPVFTTEETQLTVRVDNNGHDYIVNADLQFEKPLLNKTAVGSRVKKPYASTFLLTSTTTFDYVDRTNNGPSDDDFGGWTLFKYENVHDDYRFRAPYSGLFYNRGRLTDSHDQTGSMSSGLKEVKYLQTIETKTHIAYFVTNKTQGTDFISGNQEMIDILTGSGNDRPDGLAATPPSTLDPAANGGDFSNNKKLRKLEKIVLYAKKDHSKPISVTYFEYDQSLCHGIPNTSIAGSGKLSLKKVWTEGGGVAKTRIAPYQFKYNYFRDYPNEITEKYTSIGDVYANIDVSDENPNYQPGMLDMWGNYRVNAATRFKNMQPWLDQTIGNNTSGFDPAAWQLKQIILPSGGSIHIQYEQNDYLHVQDERAMVMTPLLQWGETRNSYISKEHNQSINKYFINLEKIGITSSADKEAYLQLLKDTYLGDYELSEENSKKHIYKKLYFKMLYNLTKLQGVSLSDDHCDYVSGYTSVSDIQLEGGQIFFSLGNPKVKKDKTLPRFLAYKKLLTNSHLNLAQFPVSQNRAKSQDEAVLAAAYSNDSIYSSLLDANSNGNNDDDSPATNGSNASKVMYNKQNFKKVIRKMTLANTFNYFGNWVKSGFGGHKKDKVCKAFAEELSYFKLPTYVSKKGGGIRVKRLLSYDPGIETGDAMVYGSEYLYKSSAYSNLTSGVATNEPSAGREENALVDFMERKKQKWLNKVTKGRDSKEFEGPIGESLLPGASIGYSRVIIRNIHSGKTSTGYAVNEYHTVKDYPMYSDYSSINKKDKTYKKFNLNIPLGMFNYNVNKAWVTQGYLFKLNDMHGKPKTQSTYAGYYDSEDSHVAEAYTARTAYNYSGLGSAIRSLVYDPTTSKFTVGSMKPGYEEDLTLYRSKVKDRTNDFSLELDLSYTLPYAISIGVGLSYSYSESQFSQHVTTKVLRQKTYLLSTTSTVDGVTQTTENLAFNKHTGDPVLTRTYDGYKGNAETINTNIDEGNHSAHYYALNIPASWVYSDLGPKSSSESKSNQLTANVGSIVTYGNNPFSLDSTDNLAAGVNSANFSNVVSASAVVLTKDWFNNGVSSDEVLAEYNTSTPISSGTKTELNKHYYPLRSYVFRDKTGVKHANNFDETINENIYGGGVSNSSLSMFPWINSNFTTTNEVNNQWFSASRVNMYSPHGVPLEEQDVLNINSTAHFGYKKTLPTLVAQNAKYNEVKFNDYENSTESNVVNTEAHSGSRSLKIISSMTSLFRYDFTSDIVNRGVTIKLWLKSQQVNSGLKNPTPNLKALISGSSYSFNRIAQTGEWSLFTLNINKNSIAAVNIGAGGSIDLEYNLLPGENVFIDDVRIQPLDAVMNCTVYTKDNRVAAQFDDQHFGVFYEYNTEGQLVRKSIETERGRKTVQEQQNNISFIKK